MEQSEAPEAAPAKPPVAVRSYLNATITPVLLKGLMKLEQQE
jgi:hypothetical protein